MRSYSHCKTKLVQHVKKELKLFNQSDDLRGFHPHITVAFRDLKKATFEKIWEEYQKKTFRDAFECNSICLLKQVDESWEMYRHFNTF